jgi:hypothetical protein
VERSDTHQLHFLEMMSFAGSPHPTFWSGAGNTRCLAKGMTATSFPASIKDSARRGLKSSWADDQAHSDHDRRDAEADCSAGLPKTLRHP